MKAKTCTSRALGTLGEIMGTWWCRTHQRPAPHVDAKGKRCCNPRLGGIAMPCSAEILPATVEYTPGIMLSNKSYTEYLEAVVLSLLAERRDPDADIPIIDDQSIMCGFAVAPINLRHEICCHRADGTGNEGGK